MSDVRDLVLSKVPAVTLTFWIIKIAATTLGETGGDSVTMTLLHADKDAHNGGYLIGTALFFSILVALVIWQIAASGSIPSSTGRPSLRRRRRERRWPISLIDPWGSAIPAARRSSSPASSPCSACLVLVPRHNLGGNRQCAKAEAFYWAAITFSQTLGTALGDWMADTGGLGYEGGALVFAAGLAILAVAYYRTAVSRVFLFWAAFILTRPLGATVGDLLDKPKSLGGFALSRPIASAVLGAVIIALIIILPQRAGGHPRE